MNRTDGRDWVTQRAGAGGWLSARQPAGHYLNDVCPVGEKNKVPGNLAGGFRQFQVAVSGCRPAAHGSPVFVPRQQPLQRACPERCEPWVLESRSLRVEPSVRQSLQTIDELRHE